MKNMVLELQSSVENRLGKIESLFHTSQNDILQRESIIQESVERALRASNVILYNVPEKNDVKDVDIANDILECVDPSAVVCPDNVSRIGKQNRHGSRPLRLTFAKVDTAKMVLRKRYVLKNSNFNKVVIANDQTRLQQEYHKSLQRELNMRKSNGEHNLTIKYINNVPQIVVKTQEHNQTQNVLN